MAARFVERVSRPGSDFDEGNTNPRTGFVAGSPQPSPLGSPGTERVNRLLNRARAVRRGFGGPFRQVRGSPSGTLAGAPPHPPRDSHRTQDSRDACDQSRRGAAAFGRGGLLTDGVLRACGGQAYTPCERRDRTRRRSSRCQGDPCDPPRRTTPAWTGANAAQLGRSGAGPARFGFHVAWHAEIAGRAPAARHNADDTSRVPEIRRRPLGVSSRQQGTRALSQRTE